MNNSTPLLAITSGEPSGIGPEVTLKALTQAFHARILVIGNLDWLKVIAQRLNLKVSFIALNDVSEFSRIKLHDGQTIYVLNSALDHDIQLGELNVKSASYVIETLSKAHHLAFNKKVDAIVTAPVHKGIINQSGIRFTGHTEYFAEQSQLKQVVMMLACDSMRVALVTTHLPLKEVAAAVNANKISQVLDISIQGLHQHGINKPRIKVLGLNPHAGESGHLGLEEIEFIHNVIEQYSLRKDSEVSGPYPADTAFSQSNLKTTDLFLAMYHDQGLPVIKFASFGKSANVTLGLPYIRTSVDHGTAIDIATQFKASSSSMEFAVHYSIQCINQSL